ncbi:MAG: fructosamine kinase family protein [Planctomycetota bacterium]
MSVTVDVAAALGVAVKRSTPVGGGCIAEASRVELADGRTVFAKGGAGAGGFAAEAAGLRALAQFAGPRVPAVLHVDECVLVLEWLDLEPVHDAAAWGTALAGLHRNSAGAVDRFGFDVDGALGSTPQSHSWCEDWVTFWRERRLRPMLELIHDAEVRRLGDQLDAKLDQLLAGGDHTPCLIHGDLWSGNLAESHGRPTTFDPAACYAGREADLGMLRWMGNLGPNFESAYADAFPLPPGSNRRVQVYELHHHLNHLHLFGSGYRGGCLRLMSDILR